ncbi:MAG: hypothetical protein PVH88_15070 [Ignavibacteria bacterium]|jgi:hypothetical protein
MKTIVSIIFSSVFIGLLVYSYFLMEKIEKHTIDKYSKENSDFSKFYFRIDEHYLTDEGKKIKNKAKKTTIFAFLIIIIYSILSIIGIF